MGTFIIFSSSYPPKRRAETGIGKLLVIFIANPTLGRAGFMIGYTSFRGT
jgi:hypothetical protein